MYEQEKEAARLDFVQRFVWNDEDCVLLKQHEGVTGLCEFCEGDTPAVNRLHDYEDDKSGGAAICEEHSQEVITDGHLPPEWVSFVAGEAWEGVGAAAGNGWKGLWFLFATPGTYSKDGVWPYEGGN